jgi:hypothetical protein
VENLIPRISEWFLSKEEHLRAFADYDSRLEGWFKGELFVLLKRLKDEEIIKDFQRELKLPTADGRRQIDFKIVCGNESLIWEIKALCISRAGGTPRNLSIHSMA